mgnify:CR=1 FL=1
MSDPLPSHDRPFTDRRYRTDELPDTPTRHFRIPATGWVDAPEILLTLGDELGERFKLRLVSRVESASPSTGSMAAHRLEQSELIDEAFADLS